MSGLDTVTVGSSKPVPTMVIGMVVPASIGSGVTLAIDGVATGLFEIDSRFPTASYSYEAILPWPSMTPMRRFNSS